MDLVGKLRRTGKITVVNEFNSVNATSGFASGLFLSARVPFVPPMDGRGSILRIALNFGFLCHYFILSRDCLPFII